MAGFQERWVSGKTIEKLVARKRPRVDASSRPGLVYDESCAIHFADGSRLVLLASDDADGAIILTGYYPAQGGE